MYCVNCGKSIPDYVSLCPYCGERISSSDSETTAYPEEEHATAQQDAYVPPQQPYAAPVQTAYAPYQTPMQPPMVPGKSVETVTGIGQYIGWWLVPYIPLVGIILVIVFACDSSKKNRANFFRAMLLMVVISIALSLIFFLSIGSIIGFGLSDIEYMLNGLY